MKALYRSVSQDRQTDNTLCHRNKFIGKDFDSFIDSPL